MLKEVEVIIRNDADKVRLEELLGEGWEIYDRGYLLLEGEPTRAFFKLSKESEIDGSIK